jgi:hypothetical protein
MAIVQISKIQQRSGNLVDLPQLDEAELGFASDAKKVFIGKTASGNLENIEVLTSYSDITFSQIDGAVGNLNIANTVANGEILAYDGTNWVNKGGNAGGTITLGAVSDVEITGGTNGYVLQTDGVGNLSWGPSGVLTGTITGITQTNPAVVTTTPENFFTNATLVTVSDVGGMTQVNGVSYYVKVLTSTTFELYTDSALTVSVDATGYGAYTTGGRAVTSIGGGGGSAASGTAGTIQLSAGGGIFTGTSAFSYDTGTSLLTVTGNASIGNVTSTGTHTALRYVSSATTGTAPFEINSTTRVANLNVAYANVSDFGVVGNLTTGSYYPALVDSTGTGNKALNVSGGYEFDTANAKLNLGNITALFDIAGTTIGGSLTTAAQPNITSVGTLTSLTVTGALDVTTGVITGDGGGLSNVAGANVSGTVGFATVANSVAGANVSGEVTFAATANAIAGANVSGQSANALVAGTVYTPAQPNITSVGTLSSLTVTANVGAGNFNATGKVFAPVIEGTSVVTGSDGITMPSGGNIAGNGSVNITGIANISAMGEISAIKLTGGEVQTSILTTGANTTAGSITGNWTLTTGSRLESTYADLAEYYKGEEAYEVGTVVCFGGTEEVHVSDVKGSRRVAGIVSTNPAYIMNQGCSGIPVAVALQGRVPCKVTGKCEKGDVMVSDGQGGATAWYHVATIMHPGMTLGKAIEDKTSKELSIIEVAVGRL